MQGASLDAFEVMEPGVLTTVQDLGRTGYQQYGVPTSGAMDRTALRAANLLLGNEEGCAGLEATMEGPTLRVLTDVTVAIVGADMQPRVDGSQVEYGAAVGIHGGQILQLQRARHGLRAYLAVAGGIDVPVVLGSRSTCLPAAFGGFQGRALRRGDRLAIGPAGRQPWTVGDRRLPQGWLKPTGQPLTVRVVLGLQDDHVTPEGIRAFLDGSYRCTSQMDRMGARLQGPPIAHRSSADIVSDSTPLGAVQVAADGQPMILLADRQTTGGYTKIAVVIQEDIYRLGQARPGQVVRFRRISLAEACVALRRYEERFETLGRTWRGLSRPRSSYRLSLGAGSYQVGVENEGRTYRVSLGGVERTSEDAEEL